jgi:hypothetical protein
MDILRSALDHVLSFLRLMWVYMIRYPLVIVVMMCVCVGMILYMILSPQHAARLNVGGILGWLLGRNNPVDIPSEKVRVQKRETPIDMPDDHGYVERDQDARIIYNQGLLRDKSTVKIVHSDGSNRVVALPEGVIDTDVSRVILFDADRAEIIVRKRPDATVTQDLLGFFIVFMSFVLSITAHAQGACPEGYRCLPHAEAAKVRKVLETYQCMEEAANTNRISMSLDPYTIILTQEGAILTDERLKGHLVWCDWHIEWSAKPRFRIAKAPDKVTPDYGARVRFRLGVGYLFHHPHGGPDTSVLVEPFYYKAFHPVVLAGWKSMGLGIAFDITNTVDLYGAVAFPWGAIGDVAPLIGISVALH